MSKSVSTSCMEDMLSTFCRNYGIEILYVFGSRTNEIQSAVFSESSVDHTSAADVDIAIKLLPDQHLTIREKAELAIALEDLLEVGRVDLILLSEADPFLAANTLRGARLYCKDTYSADEYELYILRRAGDLAPFERQRQKMILNRNLHTAENFG